MRKLALLSLVIIGFISAVAVPQTQAQESQQKGDEWATLELKSTLRGATFEGTCFISATTGEVVIEGTTTLKNGTQVEVSATAVITTGTGKQASWKLEGDVATDSGTGGVHVTAKSFTSMLDKFTTKVIAASK